MSRPSLPPDSPDWPCRTPFHVSGPAVPPRLVGLLYVLMRDYVQPGDLEETCINLRHTTALTEYTNSHLHRYALSLATYLTDTQTEETHDPRREHTPS